MDEEIFYIVNDISIGSGFAPGHISMIKYKLRKIICSKCGNHEEDIIERIENMRMRIR
jgi:ascorbate-specific PTS system EIIC-type component UlaA